jgi:REP-associated tyrosine transposase
MAYDKGCHTVFYHRYHIVWATKYRYAVLRGALRLRVREILQYLEQHIAQPTGVSR